MEHLSDPLLRQIVEQRLADQESTVPQLSRRELEEQVQALQVEQIVRGIQSQKHAAMRRFYADLFDLPSVGVCIIGAKTEILYADEEAVQFLSGLDEALDGRTLASFVAEQDRKRFADWQQSLFASQEEIPCRLQLIRSDGSTVEALLRGQQISLPSAQNESYANVLVCERPPAPQTSNAVETDERLLRYYETDRFDLAAEIHDGPMQDLSSTLFRLSTLDLQDTTPDLQEALRILGEELRTSIQWLRRITNRLRPPTLHHFGLRAAVRSFLEQVQNERPDLQIALLWTADDTLNAPMVELLLFRFLVQFVRGVADHIQSPMMMARLTVDDDEEVTLEVEVEGTERAALEAWIEQARGQQTAFSIVLDQIEALNGTVAVQRGPDDAFKFRVALSRAAA